MRESEWRSESCDAMHYDEVSLIFPIIPTEWDILDTSSLLDTHNGWLHNLSISLFKYRPELPSHCLIQPQGSRYFWFHFVRGGTLHAFYVHSFSSLPRGNAAVRRSARPYARTMQSSAI